MSRKYLLANCRSELKTYLYIFLFVFVLLLIFLKKICKNMKPVNISLNKNSSNWKNV